MSNTTEGNRLLKEGDAVMKRLKDWMVKGNISRREATAVCLIRFQKASEDFQNNPHGDHWAALENAMMEYQCIVKNMREP